MSEPTSNEASAPVKSAERQAVVILEVLAGMRTAPAAADDLSVGLNRYYQLEERAVAGLVEALKPRPRGPRRDLEKELRVLEKDKKRLQEDCARYQALVRTAQLSVGLRLEDREAKAPSSRRKRKPTVRALRAIARVESSKGKEQE